MDKLISFADGVERMNDRLGKSVAWLTAILMLVVCLDVLTRSLGESRLVFNEISWHLFAIIFLLGAGYTLKQDRHVRVDVIYCRLSERGKAWVNLLGSLIFLLPFMIVTILASWQFVANSYMIGETSPNPGGLPARYLLKAMIPLGCLFLLLQGLSLMVRSIETLMQSRQSRGGRS